MINEEGFQGTAAPSHYNEYTFLVEPIISS